MAADEARLAQLRRVCGQFEIRADFASKLRALESFDTVILIDDSGSMASAVESTSGPGADPYASRPTRWTEVQRYCNVVVDLVASLDPDGVDVRFLNRPGFSRVTNMAQVAGAFAAPPSGFTPLTVAITSILQEKAAVIAEKKLLLIIATDGEPTDAAGKVDIPGFVHVLRARPANVFVSIVACTDDEGSVGYLNKLDKSVPRLDVTDDYISERREVLRAQVRPRRPCGGCDVSCRESAHTWLHPRTDILHSAGTILPLFLRRLRRQVNSRQRRLFIRQAR
jgi:hypothetical protein